MAKAPKKRKRNIENYVHMDKERANNPPVGLVAPETDRDAGRKTYAHDPHIDPQLSWAGKAEHTAFEVPTVSLHVHERIDPCTVVEGVRKRNGASLQGIQGSLFDDPEENPPIWQAIDFYRHRHNWTNRLVAGDSLLVMNSLLEKEGLGGQVQMVYVDPPYGIRYGSNFQPFVKRQDVTDGRDEDLTSEPETIRAFQDTWELGIHSYLTYLRDRLLLARELLHESGSCFVQIGKENVYYELACPDEEVGSGFRYRSVGDMSPRTLGYDEPSNEATLYDQPYVDRAKARITGPSTVEAVPAPVVKSLDDVETAGAPPADESAAHSGETLRQSDWRDELLKIGIRGKAGQRISFARLEPLPGTAWLHVDGETHPGDAGADGVRDVGTAWNAERVVISFGPDHTPLKQRQVALAIEEAQTLVPRPKVIVFAAFQFDPEAAKDIDETNWPDVTLLKAQMNADLLTEDLKRKRASNESFWLIGQPDAEIERIADGEHAGRHCVSVQGFDYYNTKTGGVESGGKEHIALWMLDPDYDGRSLFPRQVFIPDGRRPGRLVPARPQPQGRDRPRPDRSLSRHGLPPLRARRTRPRRRQDRGRPGDREPEDRGDEVMEKPGKSEAIRRLQVELEKVPDLKRLTSVSSTLDKWRRHTILAIENVFGAESDHVKKFKINFPLPVTTTSISDSEFQESYINALNRAGALLESIIEEIRECWKNEDQELTIPITQDNGSTNKKEIFIIHGRDNEIKETVARFLNQLALNPVILHEQPNQGRTIIEKFERHAQVGFAVALLTPDDVGAFQEDTGNLKPRARQNVIFEFGYFIGRLGRNHVCALTKGDVEIPSDYDGVIYIPVDDAGGWKMKFVKELQDAGLDVDANRAL